MMPWLTSGHDVPLEAARSDHRFSVAWMTSRPAGRMRAELAWPRLRDRGARRSGAAGRGRPIPAGGARVTRVIMAQPGSLDPFPVIV